MANILQNSTFSLGLAPWKAAGSPALFEQYTTDPVKGNVMRVRPGASPIQVYQAELVVPVGRYRLSFDGRYEVGAATTGSPITNIDLINDLTLGSLGLSRQFTFGTTWQTQSFEFEVAGAISGFAGRLVLSFFSPYTFYLDNIILDSLTAVPPPPPPVKFKCQSDGTCVQDAAGIYDTLAQCQAVCQQPPPPPPPPPSPSSMATYAYIIAGLGIAYLLSRKKG